MSGCTRTGSSPDGWTAFAKEWRSAVGRLPSTKRCTSSSWRYPTTGAAYSVSGSPAKTRRTSRKCRNTLVPVSDRYNIPLFVFIILLCTPKTRGGDTILLSALFLYFYLFSISLVLPPDLTSKSGFWAKALSERHAVHDGLLFFYVDAGGDVHYGLNGESKGVFMQGIDTRSPLWVLLDIYGNSTIVEFLDCRPQLNNNRISRRYVFIDLFHTLHTVMIL